MTLDSVRSSEIDAACVLQENIPGEAFFEGRAVSRVVVRPEYRVSLKTWVSPIESQTCDFLSALAIVRGYRTRKAHVQRARLGCLLVVYFLSSAMRMLFVAVPVIVRLLSID